MCIYKIAKRIVESREKKEEKIARKYQEMERLRREEWNNYLNLIGKFAKKYVDDLEAEYLKHHLPKFKEGQKVLLHPYYNSDGWEPSGYALFSHTPFEGPVEVVIDKIHIDSAKVFEMIMDYARDKDYFSQIMLESDWNYFKRKADDLLKSKFKDYQPVMHQYSFHTENTEKQWWRYPMREDKFVTPNSKVGKTVKKIAELKKKKKELKTELAEVQEEARELYNLI